MSILQSGSFWAPAAISEEARGVDELFQFILILSTVFFVAIVVTTLVFVVKYRRKPGQRTSPNDGNVKLEVVWTVVPAVILMFVFVWSMREYISLSVVGGDPIEVRVTGQRWVWSFDYPRDGVKGASELVVPVNRAVKLTMNSTDVIHSFYLPALRLKKDVVPNRYSVIGFTADTLGEFPVFCAEYCGRDHSQMNTTLKVLSTEDYAAWIKEQQSQGGGDPVALGKKLFQNNGCMACHSLDGAAGVGPSLKDLYGKTESLADGSSVEVDDNYIRESLMDPGAKVVKGFPPAMPTFQGRFDDGQVNAIIDYIRTLAGVDASSGGSDPAALAARGKELVESKAMPPCTACHTLDGTPRVGPSFQGLWGKTETLADDSTVVVDQAYLGESLKDPGAKVVKGFPPAMSNYSSMPDADIAAIGAYLQTLSGEESPHEQ